MAGGYPSGSAYRPGAPAPRPGSQRPGTRVPPQRPKAPVSARTPVRPLNLPATARFALGRLFWPFMVGAVGYDLYRWWFDTEIANQATWTGWVMSCGVAGPRVSSVGNTCGSGSISYPSEIDRTLRSLLVGAPTWRYQHVGIFAPWTWSSVLQAWTATTTGRGVLTIDYGAPMPTGRVTLNPGGLPGMPDPDLDPILIPHRSVDPFSYPPQSTDAQGRPAALGCDPGVAVEPLARPLGADVAGE